MPAKGPSLIELYPEIASTWHPSKNPGPVPFNLSPHAKLMAWWLCQQNTEHEWQQRVDQRVKQAQCPQCAVERISLLHLYPEVAGQWHPSLNGALQPSAVAAKSGLQVWWQCPDDAEHVWKAIIGNRTNLGHGCPFCKGRKVDHTNSLAAKRPDLAREWHPTKNGDLTADQFTCGSHQKIWWLCSKSGCHEWQTVIKARALNNDGCPRCVNRVAGHNRLSDAFPEIAAEWHPTKNRHIYPVWLFNKPSSSKRPRNRRLRPSDVPAYGNESVWWQCKNNAAHVWITRIAARTKNGSGCPFCAGRKVSQDNNLEKKYPGVAKLWHPTRNGALTPANVTPGVGTKVWWRCFRSADHVWQATVCSVVWSHRTGDSGCPFCAGRRITKGDSLAAKYPQIARLWHASRNGDLQPSQVTVGCEQKAWWQCDRSADHVFQATVHAMVKYIRKGGTGCPYCKGFRVSKENSLAAKYPNLLEFWDKIRNGAIKPTKVTHGSSKLVWWRCPKSGLHVWKRTVCAMVGYWKRRGALCPFCLNGK